MAKRFHDRVSVLHTDLEIRVRVSQLPSSCLKCPFKVGLGLCLNTKSFDYKLKEWVDLPEDEKYYTLCCRYMMKPPEREFSGRWLRFCENVYHEDLSNNRWSRCPLHDKTLD